MSGRAVVVVSGDDVYEDMFNASIELQDILTSVGFAASVGMGTGRFGTPFADDLVVLYSAVGEFGEASQRGLSDAVSSGVGLLAIHSTAVLGEDQATMASLVGGRYSSHGPTPHESRFTAHVDSDHEITEGLDDFEVTHEHYRLDVTGRCRVLVWRDAPYGREPVLYVREVGRGRVCYLQLGHDMRVWDEPNIRTMIGRAAGWAQRTEHKELGQGMTATHITTGEGGSHARRRP
jgi:type 1 glutamine amidotransferase